MKDLNKKVFGSLFLLLVAMAGALFLPAWTLNYWQAWLFLGVYGMSGLVIIAYLMIKNPQLLERRMHGGPTAEKRTTQKIIMSIESTGFAAILIVSAFDRRFHWSTVPFYIAIAGDLLIIFGWTIVFFAFKENSFASATIELAVDQKVISTGPYAIVRHPMYAGSFMYFLGIPVALGSWCGLLLILLTIPAMVWRLFDEEKFLKENLPGYAEYCEKVRFRLIPFVW